MVEDFFINLQYRYSVNTQAAMETTITVKALIPKLYIPKIPAGINASSTSCIMLFVVIGLLLCGAADT
jgi:hypothetical protein